MADVLPSPRPDEYRHPKSGRVYRQGDPAHTYMLALVAARSDAAAFLRATERLADGDYLDAHTQRDNQVAYRLRDGLDCLFNADTSVGHDRDRREAPDDDWRRRYGPVADA